MPEFNLLDTYPKTMRDVAARLVDKEINRAEALRFERAYFDGPRSQGYGGYRYDGRWVPIARKIAERYRLRAGDTVLDVGCAKGFLVKDLADIVPGLRVVGLDVSHYALANAHPDAKGKLVRGTAAHLPFADGAFACALAINVVHNLDETQAVAAICELERVAPGRAYLQVDAYRDEAEREAFLAWVLTARTYGTPEYWRDLFARAGYTGDYYWTIIESGDVA